MPFTDEHGDDLDRMFAHLASVEPPADFVARVMQRAQQTEAAAWPRWQQALFGVTYLAALVGLAILAFLTGRELEHTGLRDLLSLAVHDITLVVDSPGPYLAAIRDAVPWMHVLAVIADVVLLAVATRLVLRTARRAEIPMRGIA